MNATTQIEQLLEQNGAQLVRNGKHKVYRLANGAQFVRSHNATTNAVTERNVLTQLRKLVKSSETPLQKQIARTVVDEQPLEAQPGAGGIYEGPSGPLHGSPVQEPPEPEPTDPPQPPPPPEPPPQPPMTAAAPSLLLRLDQAIERAKAECAAAQDAQLAAMAAVEAVERRIKMLAGLREYADDATTEALLASILPPQPKHVVAPLPLAPRIQVTRDIVWQVAKQFDSTYTVNEVMGAVIAGRVVSIEERHRVRQSIHGCMVALDERGLVQKTTVGKGRASHCTFVNARVAIARAAQ